MSFDTMDEFDDAVDTEGVCSICFAVGCHACEIDWLLGDGAEWLNLEIAWVAS